MIVFLLTACIENLREFPDEQLLPLADAATESAGNGGDTLEISGSADAGWTLVGDSQTLTMRSPSRANLGRLNGSAARLVVEEDADGLGVSWVAIDSRGIEGADSVGYLYEEDSEMAFAKEAFGENFVAFGGVSGTGSVQGTDVFVWDLVFQTDDGDAWAVPGEPRLVTIAGITYRLTVLAAWSATRNAPQGAEFDSDCSTVGARIAFEMLVEPDYVGDEEPLQRGADDELGEPAACG